MKYSDFETETGWGDILGLGGVNCRHSWGNYFPGISIPPPSEEELAEQHKRDTKTKHYKRKDSRGVERERDFTLRDALDRQRDLERQMKDTRKQAVAMKTAEQTGEYTALKARYQVQSAEYKRFSEAMGIVEQRERIYMDGLGQI